MQLQRQFCFLLVGTTLLLLVSLHVDVIQTASIYAPDFNDSSAHFLDQQRSCRDLCSFCPTCNGFYCGEECICECSQDPTEHAKCIDLIKANSEQLGLVYDLFIQLPQKRSTRTRFGRRAKTPEQQNDGGKLSGFHKILFSNFATAKQVTVPAQPQEESVSSSALLKAGAGESVLQADRSSNSKDPLEKSEVVELLFQNGALKIVPASISVQPEETRAKRDEKASLLAGETKDGADEIVAQPGFFVPARRRRPCFGRNRNFTKDCGPGARVRNMGRLLGRRL
uniref:Uncharacterized protein n=1 Tax=Anopheles christyi TaxID=43041 RepID=A0A182JV38_9DIPT